MKNVPSKTWSGGQTRTKTHHHQKSLAILNNTETLGDENDHTMIRIQIHSIKNSTTVNPMIDSGATEDLIDQQFCNRHQIQTIKAKNSRVIYLADGEPSSMGHVTHIARVPMDIRAHKEITTFQVAKLKNHKAILGMPWLMNHNPQIDWGQGKITFYSEKCTTICLKESPTVYAITEPEALEENLASKFSMIQAKQDQSILGKKMYKDGKIPTKGTRGAAGHDLHAIEDKTIPPNAQQIVKMGIAIRLPNGTYRRMAPRSGLAIKHGITVNDGVIGRDYTGEIGAVLFNLFDYDYHIQKGERIAQPIPERILETQCKEVMHLEKTKQGVQGFNSTEKKRIEIDEISTGTLERSKEEGDTHGLLWGRYNHGKLEFQATNIRTELAIESKKDQKQKSFHEIVPEEYWDQ